LSASAELFITTAFIASMSAVVTLIAGYPVGLWLASVSVGRKILTSVLLLPFLLPAFLIGLAFRPFFGSFLDDYRVGVMAVVLAHALMNVGFIAVVTAASVVPREQVEAASLDGASPGQIRRFIDLPQQLPALSAAGLLVALYSATSFGLVVSLGQGSIDTLETGIATAALQLLDLRAAAGLALLQTALTVGFFLVSARLGAQPTVLFSDAPPSTRRSPLGMVIGIGLIGVIAWVVGGVFSRAVLEGSGLWANVLALAGRGARDILNVSVVDAVGNSLRNMVVALAVSLILAWLLSTKRVGLAVLLPLGISPVVLGLAALVVSGYLPVWASGSWVLLPLVQSIFLTPLAFQIIAPARRAFSSELREAAVLDGAKRWQVASFVELPILAKPLTAATALVSLASLGEFGAARFLAYGSDQTLPLVMFRLMSRPGGENLGMAMVAASAFIVLAAVAVWVISAVGQREHESSDHG
jgi:thiamine transport system permease protein